ncbi:basic leucine zipper 61-like [Eucalyptus grandis]|uniref:basic leucine zipper 61-like n=1 Tax=Eucalyptus grandis TaxID=71139 RepID=UPI00192E87EF|nr:basic leucine zipper 61-like [Eucalyptus grandis]
MGRDFLKFLSTRRRVHQRSASDLIAFLEAGEYRNSVRPDGGYSGFDCLDDKQLMSMFSEDGSTTVTVATLPPWASSSSGPSKPSHQNSNNEEIKPAPANADPVMRRQSPKTEPGTLEAGGSCKAESDAGKAAQASSNANAIIDLKRDFGKSAICSAVEGEEIAVHFGAGTERNHIAVNVGATAYVQSEVSALSPRVAFLDHQRLILNVDNSALKQRITALAQDKIFKDAHQEAPKKEKERLRRVCQQQSVKKTADVTPTTNPSSPPRDPPETSDNNGSKDKDQILDHEY